MTKLPLADIHFRRRLTARDGQSIQAAIPLRPQSSVVQRFGEVNCRGGNGSGGGSRLFLDSLGGLGGNMRASPRLFPIPAESSTNLYVEERSSPKARVAAHPDDADAWRMLANALVQRAVVTGNGADYDRGWKMLDKAESLDRGDIRILKARAALLLSRHRFQQAREMAEAGLKQNPTDADLLGVGGDGALETGDLDSAQRYYRSLHSASPRLTSWARLAHVAELRGNFDEAADLLQKALKAGYETGALPEARAWVRAVLGEIELFRGRPNEARVQYVAGLKESPNHLLVLEHFAELEQREGNFSAAEADYRSILAQQTDPKSQLRLAALLEARGEKREAARLREASRRFYECAVASRNEGYLRPLAVFELAEGHYAQAASLQARDVALRPTAESRALLQTILDMAAAAGKPAETSKLVAVR